MANVSSSVSNPEALSTTSIESKPSQTILIIKMILCAFFWGGTFIAGKIASSYASPAMIGLLRFASASLVLFFVMQSKGGVPKLSKKQFFGVTILALTGILAYNLFFFLGLQTVPAARASLIVANNPLIIAFGAVVFFKESLSIRQITGIIISICGATTIISDGDVLMIFSSFTKGDIAILGCVITWAIYSLAGKALLKDMTPLVAVTWACMIGTVFFIPFALSQGNFENLLHHPLDFWLSALYLGIFGSAVGFVWFYDAIKGLGATKAGVFINFVPVFGVILSGLFLKEAITTAMILGGMLTTFGVYLTNKK